MEDIEKQYFEEITQCIKDYILNDEVKISHLDSDAKLIVRGIGFLYKLAEHALDECVEKKLTDKIELAYEAKSIVHAIIRDEQHPAISYLMRKRPRGRPPQDIFENKRTIVAAAAVNMMVADGMAENRAITQVCNSVRKLARPVTRSMIRNHQSRINDKYVKWAVSDLLTPLLNEYRQHDPSTSVCDVLVRIWPQLGPSE